MLNKSKIYFLVLFLTACTGTHKDQNANADQEVEGLSTELPEGFHEFYDQFHADTVFQLEHVVFPLKGELTQVDSMETLTLEKSYSKADWTYHKPFHNDSGFNRSFTVLGNLVIEKMSDDMQLYTVERRWGKVDSTWSLIYYGTTEKQW